MIVAYITDLFAQAEISRTAREAGVELKVVSSLYKFLPEIENRPAAILVDLDASGISPTSLIVQVKQRNPELPVIAFGRSLGESLLEAARAAGADHVLQEAENTLSGVLKKLS
jgi:CheY-like chemotaxis protein